CHVLLSVLYTLSSSNQKLCVLLASKALCESQSASFFHQVSIGADFNYQLFSHLGKPTDNTTHVDANLPRATIVCISVLGDSYARFLRKLMPHEYSARLNSDHAPIVIALPLGSVLADDQDLSSCILSSCVKSWHCPWDHTVIDEVAPLFRSIMEKNYASTSGY
ncbi:separase isoform X1, partial [Tanacetum coccineum]